MPYNIPLAKSNKIIGEKVPTTDDHDRTKFAGIEALFCLVVTNVKNTGIEQQTGDADSSKK
ncbi:hypothetical protein GCM10023231_34520 [Olivibacter ginsenosidimutans]|uniref:Uncharacterized protein n=1 Tax=Olivibacter ginsenosidimutans TaxID=1176537 RepID=A0ABP9C2D2_9SPHI